MTPVQLVITQTRDALRLCLKSAKAMPPEKLAWSPMDEGRTVLDQLAECRQVGQWFTRVVRERSAEFFGPEFFAEQKATRAQATDFAVLEQEIVAVYEEYYAALQSIEEAEFGKELELSPGWTPTLLDVTWFPMRNLYYHFGQINYIQTLYGDKAMH